MLIICSTTLLRHFLRYLHHLIRESSPRELHLGLLHILTNVLLIKPPSCQRNAQARSSQEMLFEALSTDCSLRRTPGNPRLSITSCTLQGHFAQAICQTLGAVIATTNINIRFGDHKSAGTSYRKAMEMLLRVPPVALRVVGEIKMPWVEQYSQLSSRDRPDRLVHGR